MRSATQTLDDDPAPARRRKKRGAAWNMMEHAALAGAAGILKFVPHRVASGVGCALGVFYGALCRALAMRDHRIVTKNLELAFPGKTAAERDALRRAMWRSWGRFGGDCTQLLRIAPEKLRELVKIEPRERFDEIRERMKKRGALILTAHFGSFEMLHAAVSAYGAPITLVHRPMANPLADTFIRDLRSRFGTRVLARGNAARDVIRELRSGRAVAIPFDQTARRNSRVFVPFFGVMASTNSGLARLAQTSGAPVYPVVLIREGDSLYHKAFIGKEVEIVKTADREADVHENSRRFNAALEELVRAHPDHWIWMYRRWKQQPEGRCSPYLKEAPPPSAYREAPDSGTKQ